MERILLYYPAINIPNGTWLRNSLLYTDKVASIFPFEDLNDVRVNDDTKILYDEGQYEPLYIFSELEKGNIKFKENFSSFENSFFETVESNAFKQIQNESKSNVNISSKQFELYLIKLTPNILNYLEKRKNIYFSNYDEVKIERNLAILYMTMLAEYLACINNNLVIPSTDNEEYEKIAFQISDNKVHTYKIILDKCLPTPNPDIPLKDIVKFKKKRYQELLHFRVEIDKIEDGIKQAEDDQDRKRKLLQFKEKVLKEIMEIKKLLGDSKLEYVLNGFSSLLDFKESFPIIAPIGIGILSNLVLPGVGAGALILMGTLVSSYKKINRHVEANSSSYVYYAQKSGILNI